MHHQHLIMTGALCCALLQLQLAGCQSAADHRTSFSMNERGITQVSHTDYSFIFDDLSDYLVRSHAAASRVLLSSERQHRDGITAALDRHGIYVCGEDSGCSHRLQVSLVPDLRDRGMALVASLDGVSISREYQRSQLSFRAVTPFSIMGPS